MPETIIIYVDSNGDRWTWTDHRPRITGPDEINVHNHTAGKVTLPFTPEAMARTVEDWNADQQLAPRSHAGTRRVADGHGCSERVPTWVDDNPYEEF